MSSIVRYLSVKALVGNLSKEKALEGALSVIVELREGSSPAVVLSAGRCLLFILNPVPESTLHRLFSVSRGTPNIFITI